MTDSSDTEFYDANEEIGSPRSIKPPESGDFTLVTEEEVTLDMVLTEDAFESLPFEIEQPQQTINIGNIEKPVELNDVETIPITNFSLNTQQPTPSAIVETLEMSGQKPDLLACVQDRPTDLPGVRPVDVVAVHVDQKQMPPPVPAPPSSIKKVPPARPAPPRRPPPPKRGYLAVNKPKKPYLSEIDDGLLTPNSTVDNLTREFTEALNNDISVKQQQDEEKTTSKSEVTVSDVPHKTTDLPDRSIPRKESTSSVNTHTSPTNSLRRDEEILSGVIVKNLDTGESMSLSIAAEQVSHPLALQIISRTKEFSYGGSSSGSMNSHDAQMNAASLVAQSAINDSDSLSIASDDIDIGKDASKSKHIDGKKIKAKRKKFKKIVGKGMSKVKVVAGAQVGKAVQKVRNVKDEVTHNDQLNVSSDEDSTDFGLSSAIKIKASSSNKGPYQFSRPKQVQDIAVHVGAVWCMKFSHCGRLLATAGQDNVIWVWVLKDFYNYFNDMRNKYDSKDEAIFGAASMRPMQTSEVDSYQSTPKDDDVFSFEPQEQHHGGNEDEEDDSPFRQVPFSSYVGHAADVLDLAWSKNFFILSSSMDKTVRLWHISRKECLCCFQHIDFVTAIAFHPRDDRYFLSGSLDSKLRLWNIPDKKVALWNEVSPDGSSSSSGNAGGALITTVNFCENGKFAVCGTYDGRVIFFDTEHLKYHTQIHVRSSRGRNNKGHKITGIEPLQGEHKILVTSNDSRVRLYDLRDLSLVCKYKGHANLSSQIKASFSPDSKYIICGSEDKCVYVWRTSVPQDVTKLSSFRRDRNDCWESMKAHDAVVTCAVFAPQPQLLYKSEVEEVTSEKKRQSKSILSLSSKKQTSEEVNVIVSADFKGCIKVIVSAE